MARQIINVGTGPDTHTGEPIRSAWQKTNSNFAELYSLTANIANISANTGNITFTAQNISGQLANTDITLEPNGAGKVSVVGNLTTSHLRFLGNVISTQYAGDLVLDASAGYIKVNDPIKFPDGTIQNSASVGSGGTLTNITITTGNITTVNSTTGTFTGNVISGTFRFANGNSILSNISTVGFTGSYNDLTNKPTVPSYTSQLVNDSGFITTGSLSSSLTWSNVSGKPTFSTVATSGSYTDLSNTPNLSVYATTTYVDNSVANLVANASSDLDTLKEIADSMGNLTSIVDYIDTSIANSTPNLSSYAGNIVPSSNVTYSLGDSTHQWKDLWLSNATMYMNGVPISLTSGNVLTVNGASIVTSTAGNINVNNLVSSSNIAIDTSAEKVTVSVNLSDWVFDETGVLTAPGEIETVGNISAGYFLGDGSQLTGISSTGNLDILGTDISIAAGSSETLINISPNAEGWSYLQLPTDTTANVYNTRLHNDAGNVEIGTGDFSTGSSSYEWTFGNDGTTTFPNGVLLDVMGQIYQTGGTMVVGSSEYDVQILANVDSGAPQTWQFGTDGNLTAPGNIITTGNISVGNILAQNIRTIEGTVHIGQNAGLTSQSANAVAVGTYAGQNTQGTSAIAIGREAGNSSQGALAVAIGTWAGNVSQGGYSVAIGPSAGQTTQGENSVAIGVSAARETQGNAAIAIGQGSGTISQGARGIAIGDQAGQQNQSANAVAIGSYAGYESAGISSVSIGAGAGYYIANNTIVINSTGTNLDGNTANAFYVAPIRNDVANVAQVLFYNTTSKEVTYSNTISVAGNVTGGNLITAGSVNVAGNVNLTGAEGSDTARIFADVSGANTSLVLEVGDDSGDDIVLRHYSYAAGSALDMLTATRVSNTAANISVTGTISATGNVTANLFIGDGSQLTNISASVSTGNITFTNEVISVDTGNDLDIKGSDDNLGVYIYAHGTDGSANAAAEIDVLSTGVDIYSYFSNGFDPHVKWSFDQTGNITLPSNVAAINYANGQSIITSISTGNITFANTTISTDAGAGTGIILNSAGSGEIAMLDYVGINNTNPGYWLHIGDYATGATENTGNISIDFNNGNNSSRGTAILDWAWWDGTKGTNDRGTGVHTHFGIYKNDSTYNTKYIEFDYTSGNATVGNLTGTTGTFSSNVTAGNIRTATALRWSTGNATITNDSGSIAFTPDTSLDALSGVRINGNGYLLGPNGSRNAVLNYNSSSGTMGIYTINIYGNQSNAIVNGGTSGTGNIGAGTTNRFNTVFAVAADLSGNVTAGNVISTLYGNSSGTTATYTGNVSAGNISVTGNIQGSSSNVVLVAGTFSSTFDNTGNITLANSNVFVGVTNTILPNTVASFSSNINNYSQVTLQNKSTGTDATADYILTADNGSDTVNYFDVGIIGSGYDNSTPTNSLGNLVYAADSYIYSQGNVGNTSQSGGNLAIGTTTAGKTVKFFAGGNTSSALIATVSNVGLTMNSGNISGNVNGYSIGYRDIPQVSFSANATLAATDGGKHYYSANATATLTIPNNSTTSFSIGTAVTVVQQGSANITITPGSGVTMYMAGNSTSASRTLSNYGMATIMKVATDTWFINGTGLV